MKNKQKQLKPGKKTKWCFKGLRSKELEEKQVVAIKDNENNLNLMISCDYKKIFC